MRDLSILSWILDVIVRPIKKLIANYINASWLSSSKATNETIIVTANININITYIIIPSAYNNQSSLL